MKSKFVDYYMDVAQRTSELSYAVRLKVGAIIVKDNTILSYGYNGMPAGWDNTCEYETLEISDAVFGQPQTLNTMGLRTRPEVLHAESNAIAKVSRSTLSSDGSTMFCTHAPCIECAKLMFQSGVKSLYFKNYYRDNSGLEFLKRGKISVHHYDPNL